jgi:hypothetical protein
MRISRRVETLAPSRSLGSGNNAATVSVEACIGFPLPWYWRTIPKYQSIDVTALATAVLRAPLEAVGQAISAKDASQFDIAYAQLTEACNVCHRNRNHAAIVIKVPDAAMFSDQEFQPWPPRQ